MTAYGVRLLLLVMCTLGALFSGAGWGGGVEFFFFFFKQKTAYEIGM